MPNVDLETSQVSNIVDSKRILSLPLLTRDPYELILLSPGTIQSNSGLGGFSVNGSRERNNNFLLDGADNNDTSVPGRRGLVALNPDATEEFRVITSNFMPEYGRNNGAIIDVVTKSGSNEWHGERAGSGATTLWSARLLQSQYRPRHWHDGSPESVCAQPIRVQFGWTDVKNKHFSS